MELTTVDVLVRIFVAIFIGGILGLERSLAGKGAGIRTYAMVSLGSCIFSIISLVGGVVGNPLYLGTAIITGIGFIGAGLVLFQTESHRITGITTAAGLWVSAGLGMTAGYGLFKLGVIATVAALVIFTIFWFVERGLQRFSYKVEDTKNN